MHMRHSRRGSNCVLATLALAFALAASVHAQTGGGFDLTWNTIAGGGGASNGGGFEVDGTAGQTDAATMSGADFTLSGGFWAAFSAAAPAACVGDCDRSGAVSVDELIRMASIALGEAAISGCQDGDLNRDGKITVEEIIAAVRNAVTRCPGT